MIDIEKVIKHEGKFEKLRERQDADMLLYYLDAFTLVNSDGEKLPNADSVTLNEPRTFADAVIGILGGAKRYFNITGIDPNEQGKLENIYKRLFRVNDDVLALQNIEPLKACNDFFACLRGWLTFRCLVYQDEDRFLPELYPTDPRWACWDVDRKGTSLFSYTTRMTPDQVKATYKYDKVPALDYIDIRHVWNREEYGVFHGKIPISEKEHKLDCCPFVVVPVPTQPLLISFEEKDGLQYQGEGIYAPNRDTFPKLNELASVWATMNKMQFMAPIGFSSPSGRPLEERPYGIGVVISVEEGEKFIEIPVKELSASAQNLFGQMMASKQRGSLSDIDYGEIKFELSALAITKVTERRNQLFGPRLKAEATAEKRACALLKHQIIHGGYKTKIEDSEPWVEIDKKTRKLFDTNFEVEVDFKTISPEQNIANATICQALNALEVSKLTQFRDILQLEDPEEEIRRSELENAHKEIPLLRLYDYAVALDRSDRTEEEIKKERSQIIMDEVKRMLAQNAVPPESASGAASQPALGLKSMGLPGMPSMAGNEGAKIQREQNRRQGIAQREEGQGAKKAGE